MVEYIQYAEQLGLDEIWLGDEGPARDPLSLLAAGWFAENAKVGAIVKQGLEDVGVGINLTVPDRATSIRRAIWRRWSTA